jgi:hypothetical protein
MSITIQWRKPSCSRMVGNMDRRATTGRGGLRGPSGDAPSAGRCAAPPAGQARIWFYRDWEPSESLNLSNIDVNGVYIGSVENGSTFYRDVPAGQYHLAPQSYGHDFNQDKDIELGADQQVYVKIVSLRLGNWGRVAKNLTSIATHFMLG